MKKLNIIMQQAAIEDLEEIWLFTFQTWSQEQADRYHDLIIKEIQFLAGRPGSGKEISHIRVGYRSSRVKSHIIFYKYSESEIEIVRILHGNMDIPNRLNE